MQVVDPSQQVHPLRLELDDESIGAIMTRVWENDDSLTLDEIECAMDWLYDYIVAEQQTVPGTTVLQ